MIDPPISTLLEKTDDRFTLCIFAAKRARQLIDGAKCLVKVDGGKPVTIAINEIDAGKVKFKRMKRVVKLQSNLAK
ncbi:DNA-directed RNA polymerase subunit omega [Petroclostridium sp. X23]|uniref:DNA-directed RNA polymerase subunit omega n=1 Tax=Petroclostridium sp. X23 TaxID=3045146 RepID=UPI0024AC9A86|nr:DNA-directed RNA polymerase subunit omega [Petroclostridium sp. X23]WHH58127.1 DNA-directed RNA polymerase subunit omega [Petroclostridium sp. X23]